MEAHLEHLSAELSLIEEQLETKTLPYSDRQLLIRVWNEVNEAINDLLEPPQALEIAPPPPDMSCQGCIENQPNQVAHMDAGGCLAEDSYIHDTELLLPEEDVSKYNDMVDDRSCERCAGCSNCATAEASYDGADEI